MQHIRFLPQEKKSAKAFLSHDRDRPLTPLLPVPLVPLQLPELVVHVLRGEVVRVDEVAPVLDAVGGVQEDALAPQVRAQGHVRVQVRVGGEGGAGLQGVDHGALEWQRGKKGLFCKRKHIQSV